MASLIKVDEMEANSAPLMKFNVGAYNEAKDIEGTWNPQEFPVVVITGSGDVAVHPNKPTGLKGMYMTVVYADTLGVISLGDEFAADTDVPDVSSGDVHRVYYSANDVWNDA
jgi:hypothetical protein